VPSVADLERLCAPPARNRGVEPFQCRALVDRRTLADSYLPALAELYLLTGITEYDNSQPRSVRLCLRDTGLVTAFADGTAGVARSDFDREQTSAAVREFLDAYDAPPGLPLVGDTVRGSEGIEDPGDGPVQAPYWLYLLLCWAGGVTERVRPPAG